MDRAQLEALALKKLSAPKNREELELAALKKLSGEQDAIDQSSEAELGLVTRAKYALEPIESNREALLKQEFGSENVTRDSQGNIVIKQGDVYRPVNKPGLSIADVADVAGATPEIAGTALGALAGGFTPASIPGAIAGGALGSGIRQGLSAAIGTPQVATAKERAIETGLSGGLSALGPIIGRAFKPAAKSVLEPAKQALKTTLEQTGEATITQGKKELADQSQRLMVQREAAKLDEIAKRQGLPKSTYAQTAGGKAILAEQELMDTPLVGSKISKYVDDQLESVKKNLQEVAGDFLEGESKAFDIGIATKKLSEDALQARKAIASNLYDIVDKASENTFINKRTFLNKFRDKAGELGLIRPDMTRETYSANSGFTRDTFNELQNIIFDGLDAIKSEPSSKIRFQGLHNLMRTIKSSADEQATKKNFEVAAKLRKFGNELEDTAENILNAEVPRMGKVFKEARKNWAKFRDDEEYLAKFIPENYSEEKIVKKIMSGSKDVERFKNIIGDKAVQDIGKSYVRDILVNLGKSGVARADSALSAIRNQRGSIITAIGEKNYNKLADNLYYLNRVNKGISVGRPSLLNLLFDETKGGLKGLTVRIATTAKNVAVSKGLNPKDVAKETVRQAGEKITYPVRQLSKYPSIINVLSDPFQREMNKPKE